MLHLVGAIVIALIALYSIMVLIVVAVEFMEDHNWNREIIKRWKQLGFREEKIDKVKSLASSFRPRP